MVSSFEISITLNIPRDALWRVRATKTFTQFLVSNGALNRMDSTPARPTFKSATSMTRTQTYVPASINIPEVIKPIFDDSYIEINDIQTWDEAEPFVQNFNIKPAIMAEVIRSTGRLIVREDADGRCVHTLSGECTVSVPFLGWHVEQAIIENMKFFYKDYGRHIDEFVDMVVNKFGEGSVENLGVAVDRLCVEEKHYNSLCFRSV